MTEDEAVRGEFEEFNPMYQSDAELRANLRRRDADEKELREKQKAWQERLGKKATCLGDETVDESMEPGSPAHTESREGGGQDVEVEVLDTDNSSAACAAAKDSPRNTGSEMEPGGPEFDVESTAPFAVDQNAISAALSIVDASIASDGASTSDPTADVEKEESDETANAEHGGGDENALPKVDHVGSQADNPEQERPAVVDTTTGQGNVDGSRPDDGEDFSTLEDYGANEVLISK